MSKKYRRKPIPIPWGRITGKEWDALLSKAAKYNISDAGTDLGLILEEQDVYAEVEKAFKARKASLPEELSSSDVEGG